MMKHAPNDHLSIRHYGAAPGGHVHDHFQVLLAMQGCLELEVEGRGMALSAGQGHVLHPGERHDFESRTGSRCLVLDTGDSTWTALPRAPCHPRTLMSLASFLDAARADRLTVSAALGSMLLARAWGPAPQAPLRVRRPVDWTALGRWVEDRLTHPLTAAHVAERAHLSESQLRVRCLEEFGLSPMQWVRERRRAHAAALRAAGLSVAEAARRSGYSSPSALTAAMQRAKTGVSRR